MGWLLGEWRPLGHDVKEFRQFDLRLTAQEPIQVEVPPVVTDKIVLCPAKASGMYAESAGSKITGTKRLDTVPAR